MIRIIWLSSKFWLIFHLFIILWEIYDMIGIYLDIFVNYIEFCSNMIDHKFFSNATHQVVWLIKVKLALLYLFLIVTIILQMQKSDSTMDRTTKECMWIMWLHSRCYCIFHNSLICINVYRPTDTLTDFSSHHNCSLWKNNSNLHTQK